MTPKEARKKNKGTSLSQSQNIKIQEKDIRQRIHSKLDRTDVCDGWIQVYLSHHKYNKRLEW